MASIGSVNFFTVQPGFVPLHRSTDTRERPMVNGSDVIYKGYRGEPYTVTARAYATSSSDRLDGMRAINDLAGRIVNCVDDHGYTFPNVLVKRIILMRPYRLKGSQSAIMPGNYGLEAQIELQAV